ncbi:HAMP domain-containing sensor histidine kinase [Bernardetia sp. Wsw4-3y2]|uniref:sensor histidine kinase n=1 Tax=unclassified Bernardetia TaxID=2647129 RepID=UPI0030D58BBD
MENAIQDFLKNEKKQRSKNINYLVYFLFVSMSLSFVPDIYFGLWENLWYWLIPFCYLISIIIIKVYLGTDWAAHWFLLGFNIMVFYFSSSVGRNSNIHFLFFVSILLIPSILNIRSKRYVIFHTIFPLLFALILVLYDYDIFPHLPQIDDYYENMFGKVNMLLLFIILPVVTWVLIKSYQDIFNQLMESEKILLSKNIELSKTNQELDNFVYSVSHDLRAPISSVLGLINISKAESDINQLKYYEILKEKSLLKLDSFIKDILDYSRNSRIKVTPQKINWQEYITELTKEFEYLPKAKYVEVEIAIAQEEEEFYADLYRIGIIFNNLLSNAFRYSDKQKEYSFVKIKGDINKDKAHIIIQDNGIGIATEHQQKIFEMFYRASENSKGSGLGLYILKETLEKINSTIKLDSELGKGTTFYLEIPNLI